MATYDEPMPKWLEEELKQVGVRTPDAAPLEQPPKRQPPIDRWWERGLAQQDDLVQAANRLAEYLNGNPIYMERVHHLAALVRKGGE